MLYWEPSRRVIGVSYLTTVICFPPTFSGLFAVNYISFSDDCVMPFRLNNAFEGFNTFIFRKCESSSYAMQSIAFILLIIPTHLIK